MTQLGPRAVCIKKEYEDCKCHLVSSLLSVSHQGMRRI